MSDLNLRRDLETVLAALEAVGLVGRIMDPLGDVMAPYVIGSERYVPPSGPDWVGRYEGIPFTIERDHEWWLARVQVGQTVTVETRSLGANDIASAVLSTIRVTSV